MGRDAEHDVIPFMRHNGLGLTVWSPLAGGLLSGKYSREGLADKTTLDRDDRLASFDFIPYDSDSAFHIVDAMRGIAAHHDASVAQIALAWLLAKPIVHSVILGASKLSQLEDNLGAADLELGADEVAQLDQLRAPKALYPHWFNRRTADQKVKEALRN